jgi:hypothetical protein
MDVDGFGHRDDDGDAKSHQSSQANRSAAPFVVTVSSLTKSDPGTVQMRILSDGGARFRRHLECPGTPLSRSP